MYELAKESFTSPATVVRLCKKIDIKGFARLKVLLAEETKYFQDMKLNLLDTTTIEKNDSPHAIIEKITNIAVKPSRRPGCWSMRSSLCRWPGCCRRL